MCCKGYNKVYNFVKIKTIRAFGDDIINNSVNMYTANNEQNHFIKEFKSKTSP